MCVRGKEEEKERWFIELYTKYKDEMYRLAFMVLRNEQDAQDAVQNAMIRLNKWIQEERLESDEQKIHALIRTIARNEACSIYNKNQKIWKLRTQISNEISAAGQRCGASAHSYILAMESAEEIMDCVRVIREEYCEMIMLYYFQEFSIKELADIYKLTEKATATKLYRARLAVAREVERRGLGEEFLEML